MRDEEEERMRKLLRAYEDHHRAACLQLAWSRAYIVCGTVAFVLALIERWGVL